MIALKFVSEPIIYFHEIIMHFIYFTLAIAIPQSKLMYIFFNTHFYKQQGLQCDK